MAAFAAGCNLRRLQYQAIALSGILSALAGAHIALGVAFTWAEGMTGGRGFIAIALVMFARRNPWGAVAAALVFGGAEAAQLQLQAAGLDVSPFVMNMVPYVLTLAALPLTGKAGKAVAGGVVEHAIEGGARQAIQRAFRVEHEMTQRHALRRLWTPSHFSAENAGPKQKLTGETGDDQ